MKKRIYLLLILVFPIALAGAQTGFIEQLLQRLEFFNYNTPQEKIYVQTDKPFYKPGESIWYKTFLLNSTDNRPSEISDILYMELYDAKGNRVHQQEMVTTDGVCNGNFPLSTDAPGGVYRLKAYTTWMKNWDQQCIFQKEITVQRAITPRLLLKLDFEKRAYGPGDEVTAILSVSDLKNHKTNGSQVKASVRIKGKTILTQNSTTQKGESRISFKLPADLNTSDGMLQLIVNDRGMEESISRSIPIQLNAISLSFYPEGGDLVENIKSKVAFEALNEYGKGADVKGRILDENNQQVASFESFHLGMGAFTFTPERGKTYYAHIDMPQGNHAPVQLPQALTQGIVLHLKSQNDHTVTWNVHASEHTKATLVAHVQGVVYETRELALRRGKNEVKVGLKEFPAGIAVFTLFNEKQKEACERIVYVNPHKNLTIQLETDKKRYEPGEDVWLTISTQNEQKKPVAASLAISVVDEQLLTLADDRQDNMLSYILFSSELKGKVQEPNFYFDPEQPKAQEAIDYLLLTHGWRRFQWEDILYGQPPILQEGAEKSCDIYGQVLDAYGKPVETTVYFIEYNGKRRVARVKTTPEGQFAFRNIDPQADAILATRRQNYSYRKENYIHLFKMKPQAPATTDAGATPLRQYEDQILAPGENEEIATVDLNAIETDIQAEEIEVLEQEKSVENIPFPEMKDAVLEEVAIVGYTPTQRKSYTGSVVSVQHQYLTYSSGADYYFGSGANLNVNQYPSMNIRGTATWGTGDASPGIVLDGFFLTDRFPGFSFFDLLSPEDMASIGITKSPTLTFHNSAHNGVVYIDSRTGHLNSERYRDERYIGIPVPKRVFYTPYRFSQDTDNADKEHTTVYWNAHVNTNHEGKVKLVFKNNITSSSFRITAEGIAPSEGMVGSTFKNIATLKAFSVDVKTPLFASLGDVVKLPIMLKNNTDEPIRSQVKLLLPETLNSLNEQEVQVEIPPHSTQMAYLGFTPTQTQGEQAYSIVASSAAQTDSIGRTITIRSVYFPASQSISGRNMSAASEFTLPDDCVEGSFRAEAICYTNTMDELFAGLGSILREPYGCFEQTSSSTFPNIMALQAMKASRNTDENLQQHALKLLDKGYKRLASYEVSGGGFEWFGQDPAHTGLSAYGMLEFYEMGKVYHGIDRKMEQRNYRFILSRKDGKGGFNNNTPGMDQFSGSPKSVSDAYIVYTLTETEHTNDVEREYQFALAEAWKSRDMYRMALMANAAFNMNDLDNYEKLIEHFKDEIQTKPFDKMKMETSITRSSGASLIRETVALWALALNKQTKNTQIALLDKCIEFIYACRTPYGGFGNTQSTILCLQALTRYINTSSQAQESGLFMVSANDREASIDLTQRVEGSNVMRADITHLLTQGRNRINLAYSQIEKPFPYSINFFWEYRTPVSSKECPLVITTNLSAKTVKRNETVRLAITMENKQISGLPMSIAIIGIPGGMSLQSWQLKELLEKGVIDFYEIIDDNLVIYYRSLKGKERKEINIDLKAEVPGRYTGTASCTYVYYTNEYKYWLKGLEAEIEE